MNEAWRNLRGSWLGLKSLGAGMDDLPILGRLHRGRDAEKARMRLNANGRNPLGAEGMDTAELGDGLCFGAGEKHVVFKS